MGCEAHLILVDPHPAAPSEALDRLQELERCWSRFLADSELSRLNRARGSWLRVSRDTVVLIATMQQAACVTDGAYDPTFLYEVLETGYTASIEDPARRSIVVDLPCPGLSVHDAEIDERRSTARLPGGLALDAGGIGKGLAADLVVRDLIEHGTAGALVSIGGDLCAGGRPPGGEEWNVEIADPGGDEGAVVRLALTGGGIATSSTVARRSVRHGRSRHHTIDPATRRSASTDLAAVTVIAGTGWEAEAHATAALLAGTAGVAAYASAKHVTAVAVGTDGAVLRSENLERRVAPDPVREAS